MAVGKNKEVAESTVRQTEHEVWLNSPVFGAKGAIPKRWLTKKISLSNYWSTPDYFAIRRHKARIGSGTVGMGTDFLSSPRG